MVKKTREEILAGIEAKRLKAKKAPKKEPRPKKVNQLVRWVKAYTIKKKIRGKTITIKTRKVTKKDLFQKINELW
jgi:hypothetical protein